MESTGSRKHVPLMLHKNLSATLPVLFPSPIIESELLEKAEFFVPALGTAGEAKELTHLLSFPSLQEKSQSKKVLLSTKPSCLGEGDTWTVKLFLLPTLNSHFVPPVECWNSSPLEIYRFEQVSGFRMTVQVNVLCFPIQQPRGAGTSSQATAGTPAMEVSLPVI